MDIDQESTTVMVISPKTNLTKRDTERINMSANQVRIKDNLNFRSGAYRLKNQNRFQ